MESWGTCREDESRTKQPYVLPTDDVESLISAVMKSSDHSKGPQKNRAQIEMEVLTLPTTSFQLDTITKENIQLIQYTKQMEELVSHIQNSFARIDAETIPPVPAKVVRSKRVQQPSVTLTRQGAKELLHRAVFYMCAHEGFDSVGESTLDLLVDVAEEMLTKLTKLLKINTENEILEQSTGFPDAMERTLHNIGMNGVRDLYSYYNIRVLQYNAVLRQECEISRRSCITAANQWGKNATATSQGSFWEDGEWTEWTTNGGRDSDNTPSSRRQSMEYSEANGQSINQLHLEDNSNDEITPSLEPGLRMLYTLEQQEAAAAQGSMPEADDSFYITSNSPATVMSFGRENPSSIESSSPMMAARNKRLKR